MSRFTGTMAAAILGLMAIVAALILGVAYAPAGVSARSTPLVVTLVAAVGPTIAAIIASGKASAAHQSTEDLKNGLITERVTEALQRVNGGAGTDMQANAQAKGGEGSG